VKRSCSDFPNLFQTALLANFLGAPCHRKSLAEDFLYKKYV
jgi:hypothetical protein